MHVRLFPCLLVLALALPCAANAQVAPSDYSAAKARADLDEAAMPAELAQQVQAQQRSALDAGVQACASPRNDTSPFTIVVELDGNGAVAASWRNGSTPLAICMEKYLRAQLLPPPPHAPLYVSYELSFGK